MMSCKKEILNNQLQTANPQFKTSSEWEVFYDFTFYDINNNPIRITDCDYSGGTCLPEVTVTATIMGTIGEHNENGTLKEFFISGDYLDVWPDLDSDIYDAIISSSNKVVLLNNTENSAISILVVLPNDANPEEPTGEVALYALQFKND